MSEVKKTANDFIFDRPIGEGSFSTVYCAKDVHTKMEYAIKVCEKRFIRREKKHLAIMRERQIMKILTDNPSPFFIRLMCTFQDEDRLFFVMNFAKNGELLSYINKVELFDVNCARFYSAEILLALEHLHKLGIVHRDLKPENILLNEKMHIQVTDFGSALILNHDNSEKTSSPIQPSKDNETHTKRKNSFVGTAHYVSPEMLTNKSATTSSDLWAFGCILYQMISGVPPFQAPNEYLIFQKILNLDYRFPDSFNEAAKNLVEKILQINPSNRLGANDNIQTDGYISIREHEFFSPLANNWSLINQKPPIEELGNNFDSSENTEPGFTDNHYTKLWGWSIHNDFDKPNIKANKGILDISPAEMQEKLKIQKQNNIFHRFVEENLILKQGFIDKKKVCLREEECFY